MQLKEDTTLDTGELSGTIRLYTLIPHYICQKVKNHRRTLALSARLVAHFLEALDLPKMVRADY